MKFFSKKFFFFFSLSFFVSIGISLVFQSILALTIFPTSAPLLDNIFRKDVLINEADSSGDIEVNVPMAVTDDFQVGTDSLFVKDSGDVAIGTITPSAFVTVDGITRIGRYNSSTRPACTSSIVGAIYYDTSVNRPFVCTNNDGWLYF
jgi:hypothetical protein